MKASELCVLCGAEVAIVVFSPTGKPFSYGHPSTDDVFRRFLTDGGPSEPSPATALCASLNAKLLYLTNRLEYEKKRRSLLEAAVRAPWLAQKPFWWDANIHSMALEELGEFERVLLQYHDAIGQEADPRVGPCGPVSQLGCVNRWPLATPMPQFDAIDCFPPLQQPHSIVPLQAYGLGGFDYGL